MNKGEDQPMLATQPPPIASDSKVVTQPQTPPIASDSKVDTNKGGLMSIFPLIYGLMAALSVALFLIVIALVAIDILAFALSETLQKIKTTKRNFNLIYSDSNEYRLLDYASSYLTEEPYRVYTQKSLLNLSLAIVGFAIIVAGFQLGIFLVLKIRAISTGIPFTEDLGIMRIAKSFGIMGGVFIGGLILLAIFKVYFTKAYQKRAQNIKTELSEIDKIIFSNMLKDTAFLTAIANHNMQLTFSIMDGYIRNAKSTTNFAELDKLFFTLSLFNYFDSLSPVTSESRPIVMNLFNANNLSKKSVTPNSLFYYQGSNTVPNAFSTLKSDITTRFGPKSNGQAGLLTEQDLTNIESRVSVLIDNLNMNLMKLKKPGKLRAQFIIFNIVYLIAGILIAGLLYMLFAKLKFEKK